MNGICFPKHVEFTSVKLSNENVVSVFPGP